MNAPSASRPGILSAGRDAAGPSSFRSGGDTRPARVIIDDPARGGSEPGAWARAIARGCVGQAVEPEADQQRPSEGDPELPGRSADRRVVVPHRGGGRP